MTPNETFEQRMQQLNEQFRQNVEKMDAEFNRDVKLILIKGAILFIVLNAAWIAIALWLVPEGTGKR